MPKSHPLTAISNRSAGKDTDYGRRRVIFSSIYENSILGISWAGGCGIYGGSCNMTALAFCHLLVGIVPHLQARLGKEETRERQGEVDALAAVAYMAFGHAL